MAATEPRVCCAVCGSINVQHVAWISSNTGEIREDFGSWNAGDNTFCEDCDLEGRDPHPSLIDIDADGDAFNNARAKAQWTFPECVMHSKED